MAKPNNIGTCSECVYYTEDSEQSGYCRIIPPVVVVRAFGRGIPSQIDGDQLQTVFPKVAALDWCGAYIGPIPDAPEPAEYQPMTNP